MAGATIEIENLTKDYPFGFLHLKKKRSLEGLTMKVEDGEVFGFLGPNGAGKSTTIKLLMSLIFPTAGEKPSALTFGFSTRADPAISNAGD